MDSLAGPPAKRRCVMRNGIKVRLMERVREFQLPQQFPSTLKQAMQQSIVDIAKSPSVMPRNINASGVECQVPCKPQKLRIISANGKDLGEFNLQLRTDDPEKGQAIMITKNTPKPEKPVSVLAPQSKIFPRILKQGTARLPRNLVDITSCNKNNSETNNINMLQQSTNVTLNNIETQDAKIKNKEAQVCNSNKVKLPVSTNGTNSKQSMHEIISSNNQKHVVYNGIGNVNNHNKIPVITIEDNEETPTENISFKEIMKSQFPIVNCKKLVLNSSDSNDMHKSKDCFKNAISTQYNNVESSVDEKNGINVHRGKIISRHNTKGENMQSKYVPKIDSENDCSVVAVDNPVQSILELQQITNTVDSIIQLDVQNKDYTKDSTQTGLSDQLDIIKKAMDSVKDDKLRTLALKALEECGIGIERCVPISEKHKAVNDTQIQTMVFGLLEPESFIFINKDLDNIQRINQFTFCDIPSNQNQLLTNSLHSDPFFKDLIIGQENDFNIDCFLNEFVEENLDVMKMKEALSDTKIRCKNLIEHLERDFESVKRYDQNGMLNIHNAVISNNIHLVRRQLMILEKCKESVDIFTEDEKTSLELAVKYDVHSEIVELLLKAGAQPVIPKYIHESALIIATKLSSPLLPMLINRVSNAILLDQIDSEGLAALHYCSMRNNLLGVKALISAGATVDLKDMRSGRTPLFHALDNGHTAVTQALLKAGAITNVTNYAGQTPIPIIMEK